MVGPQIAAGGMGSVRVGLKLGALGFQRLVAVKRLHPHLASEPGFVARFNDEVRLVSRLTHPNIVQVFDVIKVDDELALVMEFVDGVTLHELNRDAREAGRSLSVPVAVGIVSQVLHGLHAAHEATDDRGKAFQLVHRDVSPQNIMLGKDGLVKVLDFGVAKADTNSHITTAGQLPGKISYMSPEQVGGRPVDRRTDVFAAGVVLWEALCARRLFGGTAVLDATALVNVVSMRIPPPSEVRPEVSSALDGIVLRALDRDPSRRFGSARDFALALEEAVPSASGTAVAGAVATLSSARARERQQALATFKLQIAQMQEPALALRSRSSALSITLETHRLHTSAASPQASVRVDDAIRPLILPSPEPELVTADVQRTFRAPRGSLPAPGNRAWWLALVGVPLLIAAGVAGRFGSKPQTLAAVPPSASQGMGSSTATSSSAQLPLKVPPPQAAPTAIPIEDLAALTPRISQPHRPAPALPRRVRAPAHAVTSPCSPPTYVDAEGIRHFKAECL